MIPGTLNTETHVTQIEIQNEVKTTKNKKSSNSSTTVVYSELLRQENAQDCDPNAEVIDVANGDTGVNNVNDCGKWFTVKNLYRMEIGDTNIRKKYPRYPEEKKQGLYKSQIYWVQCVGGNSAPMEYTPDANGNGFVAKVFALTLVMLLLTVSFVAYVYTSEKWREIFLDTVIGKFLFVTGSVGIIILNYSMMCSPCMRMIPCNYITLIIAVVCMSLVAAYVTAFYTTSIIYNALIATTGTVLVCLLLALSSFDFTQFMLIIIGVGVAFAVLSVTVSLTMLITGMRMPILHLIMLFIGTIINVIVILMELQMILGGRTVALGEADYPLGAFMLYTSLVDLFLKLIQIIGFFMDDED